MALFDTTVIADGGFHELKPHGTPEFPCAGYLAWYSTLDGDTLPWHWHRPFETALVLEGRMDFHVPRRTLPVRKDEIIFINSNILHGGFTPRSCILATLVYDPLLIAGSETSVFFTRYIRPLAQSGCPDALVLSGSDAVGNFKKAFSAMETQPAGFEFTIRENLTSVLRDVFRLSSPAAPSLPGRDTGRVQKMMSFIQEHYAEPLTLDRIAASSGLSQRECLRCFRKTIGVSPIQYLLKYRVLQAASLLASRPDMDISQIAYACGFPGPSSFAQTFRRYYGRTPREYRRSPGSIAPNN